VSSHFCHYLILSDSLVKQKYPSPRPRGSSSYHWIDDWLGFSGIIEIKVDSDVIAFDSEWGSGTCTMLVEFLDPFTCQLSTSTRGQSEIGDCTTRKIDDGLQMEVK
jgi:hypothetical protein